MTFNLPLLLVLVAGAPTAFAQSTVYGVADVAIEYGRYNRGVSQARVASGQLSPSRLGFRGSEQIDGELKVNYGMEIGLSLDTGMGGMGNTLLSRGSYVGLDNGVVRLDVGRMFVPIFWVYLNSDPSAVPAAAGGSMAILQHAATLGRSGSAGFFDNGVRLRFKPAVGVDSEWFYSHGNELGGARAHDGRTVGVNLTMRRQQWWAGWGYNRYTTRSATDLFDVSQTTHMAGTTYDAGWIKVGGNYLNSKKLSANGRDVASWVLSAKIPAGTGSINVGTGRLSETGGRAAQAYHAGYVLPLAKRSMLYAYLSRINNNAAGTRGLALIHQQQGTVAAGFDPTVLITGMRHDF